jgi:hypothetical protein
MADPQTRWQRWHELVQQSYAQRLESVRSQYQHELALYRGDQWDPKPVGKDGMRGGGGEPPGLEAVVNNYLSDGIEVKLASLTYKVPEFSVVTAEGGDPEREALLAQVIQDDFIYSGGWEEAQAAKLDQCIHGIGAVMVGWREGEIDPTLLETDAQPTEEEALAEEMAAAQGADMAQVMAANGVLVDPLVSPEEGGGFEGPLVVEEIPVVGEGQVVTGVSPYDLLIDPQATWSNWEREARFMGRVYSVTVDEIKEWKGLKRKDELIRKASGLDKESIADPSQREQAVGADKRVVLWDVWFRGVMLPGTPKGRRNLRVIWADGMGPEPVWYGDWPFVIRDPRNQVLFPFVVIFGRLIPRGFDSISDVDLAEPQQRELNYARSLQATHMRLAIEKLQADGPMEEEAKAALESPDPGAVVEHSGVITPIKRSPPDASVYKNADDAVRDMAAHTGVSEAARGIQIPGAQTATEINYIAQTSSARAAYEQRRFEEFVERIAYRLWYLRCDKTLFGQEFLVSGQDGQTERRRLEEEMLDKRLQVRILAGSTKLRDTQQELAGLTKLLEVALPQGLVATPANPQGIINGRQIVRQLASKLSLGDLRELMDVSEFQQMAVEQQAQAMLRAEQMKQEQQVAALAKQMGIDPQALAALAGQVEPRAGAGVMEGGAGAAGPMGGMGGAGAAGPMGGMGGAGAAGPMGGMADPMAAMGMEG